MIKTIEVFVKAPNTQYCKNVKILLDVPFSEILFEDSDFELATKITSLKCLSGFHDPEDVNIYLNDKIIINEYIFFWKNKKAFEKFIDENFKKY